MASSINALTTGSGGVVTTADNSGNLNIQSGGTTVVAVTSAGAAVTGTLTVNGTAVATAGGAITGTDLTTTGNTILGDASTDTLNVGNGGIIKDASGNVLINSASVVDYGKVGIVYTGATQNGIAIKTSDAQSMAGFIVFDNESSSRIGSITRNAATNAVLYTTTSDYRLKEQVAPLTNALDKMCSLKPVTWVWKDCNNAVGQGFIAHEVQEIIPSAVIGEKDAVNEDGSIKPQGMDASYLVATLVAAIQELKAEVDLLKGVA
jgi:hypothetical protein